MKVAILGASEKPNRFSYKAFKLLRSHGHEVYPVSPSLKNLEGVEVVKKLADIKEPIDTLTMYVGVQISSGLIDDVLELSPRRVIFNPGSESPVLEAALRENGIEVLHDCTLVMLNAGQF